LIFQVLIGGSCEVTYLGPFSQLGEKKELIMKRALLSKIYTVFFIFSLLLAGNISWAGQGAMVVFDNPVCPFRVLIWGDQDSGLTVAMAMKENYDPDGDCTLDDVVEIFLPDSATKFTPAPFIPDTFKQRGKDVPVSVYEATEEQVMEAYVSGDSDFLVEHEVAYGFVDGQFSGKAFKAITYSAIGTVELIEGGEAMLIAVGHEVYKEGPFSEPVFNWKVDLH
jgi:hypothetical protein